MGGDACGLGSDPSLSHFHLSKTAAEPLPAEHCDVTWPSLELNTIMKSVLCLLAFDT